jgi:hypothetical protein
MIERRLRDRNADAASALRVRRLVEMALLVSAVLYLLLINTRRF